MTDHTASGPHPRLDLFVDRPVLTSFYLFLQQGVRVRRRVGCSVDVFLRQEMEATAETIGRIQSIMLNGKPVDDIGAAVVHDGATLALSAAMPGLVGATLRRGGAYASFRSGITYQETEGSCETGDGWVSVKIFNLLMGEMGPSLLRQGVLVRTADLLGVLGSLSGELGKGSRATLDGNPVDICRPQDVSGLEKHSEVHLTVSTGEERN